MEWLNVNCVKESICLSKGKDMLEKFINICKIVAFKRL